MGSPAHSFNLSTADLTSRPLATPLGDYEFWFATAANKARFAADPWKFAPKYGGF